MELTGPIQTCRLPIFHAKLEERFEKITNHKLQFITYSCYLVSLQFLCLSNLSRLHFFRGESLLERWPPPLLPFSQNPPCLHPFRKSGLVMTSYVPGPGSSYRCNNFQGISSFQQPDLRHVAIPGQVIQGQQLWEGESETHDTHQLKTLTSFLPLLAPKNPTHPSSPPLGPTMGR